MNEAKPSKTQAQASSLSWSKMLVAAVTVRIILATTCPILDCDEVFNYWEGVHYLLTKTGTQTWEYAPQYALRTWFYLYPYYICSSLFRIFFSLNNRKVQLFHWLRCLQATFTAYSEVQFAKSISIKSSGITGIIFLVISLSSSGMYHASVSFLPSSTVMQLWLLSHAMLYRDYIQTSINVGILAVLGTGWPFSALLWIPMALQILWNSFQKGTFVAVISNSLLFSIVTQAIISMIDSTYYETSLLTTFPTLNILLYNVKAGGDELYGVEPFSYYIKNLILNFNFVLGLAFISIPILVLQRQWSLLWRFMPMTCWVLVVFGRPHKEERFLYPIYPSICYGATMGLTSFVSIFVKNSTAPATRKIPKKQIIIGVGLLLPFLILSVMRNIALSQYYMAPIYLYQYFYSYVPATTTKTTLCVAGEWYRYPSSFFLPYHTELAFLKSSFTGQLPKPLFSINHIYQDRINLFNQDNKEEPSRYTQLDDCNYVIDLRFVKNGSERNSLFLKQSNWKIVKAIPFLDAQETLSIYRIVYIPQFLRELLNNLGIFKGQLHFANYVLFERI